MLKKGTSARCISVAATALVAQALSLPAEAKDKQNMDSFEAYAQSEYQYCDALKVAAAWGIGAYEAKAVIGDKILGNVQYLIDQDIAGTGTNVWCDWSDLGLTYDDAVRLARYWGRKPHEAKQKASEMASDMGAKQFREVMAGALAGKQS